MRKSFKRGEILEVGGVSYTPIRQTSTLPPSSDWIESVTPNYLPETPAPVDGKDGERGADGRDGERGADGKDGASIVLAGEYRRGKTYPPLSVVTHEGSSYAAKVETKTEPPGKAWQLLAAAGADGESAEAIVYSAKGRPGRDGRDAATDLELVFDDTALAGQVVRAAGNDRCRVANGLSYYRSLDILGLVVADTLAGNTGKVRTLGLLTLPDWSLVTGCESLRPSASYMFQGYGGLTFQEPCNTAMFNQLGLAINSQTLLILPGMNTIYARNAEPIIAPCLSTLPKGTPVRLASQTEVDVASDENYFVTGVLLYDVEAGQNAKYQRSTNIAREDWSELLESGDSLLVPNQKYYLADTPGKFTTDSEDRLYIGKARNSQMLGVHVGDDSPSNNLSV